MYSNQPEQPPGGYSQPMYAQPSYGAHGIQPIASHGHYPSVPQPISTHGNQPMGPQPLMVVPQPYGEVIVSEEDYVTARGGRLFMTYKLGKLVRFIAIIDVIFVVINILFNGGGLLYIILLPWPIMGMLSGRNFNSCYATCYAVFVLVEIICRVLFVLFFPTNTFFLEVIFIVISIWIFVFIRKFIKALHECSPDDLDELRQNLYKFKRMDDSWC
mmetsp:Transcript_28138/g.35308  ORF Transcript_28138/g.35308 Transcript_28138/m.35308 type:complete len:215 (-) Transcript_28138:35-679(-)